ncbi:3-hydroxyacyl-ACP dehydratase FabZ family protein [Calycomorphotria hydatis]|uniref:3-hydroxyacyl-[acyl-carrier-protein] dehydratase FabZ n=1 Tax=Calycomorphotria hydatis TaxID=2528027 RepID=A0A517T5J2_9PLAN|nr:3-hydroxyacyl-ACP dehydratase FabZ family protein [Calycomorphotria hydatis]QDT63640.1 3-hydroxyacyl-[acyl-carrier-protein] dehydratase FabZ [Calycomorphotria hydatis]
MRWIWIDRFKEFESGKKAVSMKNVSLAEEHLHDHFPGFPVMPGSLMIEGMAQTGGILLGEMNHFKYLVVLAKVPKMIFHHWVRPGDTLEYEVTLIGAGTEGGSVECVARVGDKVIAEGEIMFAKLAQDDPMFGQIDQENFVFASGLMTAMDVTKAGDSAI